MTTELHTIYRNRFTNQAYRDRVWKILVKVGDIFSRRLEIDEAEKLLAILQSAVNVAKYNTSIPKP